MCLWVKGWVVGDGWVVFILKAIQVRMIGNVIRGMSDVCIMPIFLNKNFQTI